MRHLPRLTEDYESSADDLTAMAILTADIDDLAEEYAEDWRLDELDVMGPPACRAH